MPHGGVQKTTQQAHNYYKLQRMHSTKAFLTICLQFKHCIQDRLCHQNRAVLRRLRHISDLFGRSSFQQIFELHPWMVTVGMVCVDGGCVVVRVLVLLDLLEGWIL